MVQKRDNYLYNLLYTIYFESAKIFLERIGQKFFITGWGVVSSYDSLCIFWPFNEINGKITLKDFIFSKDFYKKDRIE